MKTLETVHKSKNHSAIIDGVWTISHCKTEIDLVRELGKRGINLQNYACVKTTGVGFNLEHTWRCEK